MNGTVFILLLGAGVAVAQSSDEHTNVACIERLDIPEYPALAESARITATVTASVRLGNGGQIGAVESALSTHPAEPVKSAFLKAVDESLRSSKFSAACDGKTITLLFQFLLGEQIGTQRFSFNYPNSFSILAPAKVLTPEGDSRKKA
jgi:hypothetical protein